MADPKRPTLSPVPQPVNQVAPKSGEAHIMYGCVMFGFGIAVIAGIMYAFWGFFVNNVWTAIIGLYVVWKLYDLVISRIKRKKEE
jgi:hypothetical protein